MLSICLFILKIIKMWIISKITFLTEGKPVRKVAALTPTFLHGVHLFL